MTVLETERLIVRHLTTADAEFILRLVNEPSFIANIGDRGIRSLEQASNYLIDGPIKSYERHGHGPYLTALKTDPSQRPIGMCGLLKRDEFQDMDLGYALLPEFWSCGYAFEASVALLEYAHSSLQAPRVLGLVSPENHRSIGLLEKLGFTFSELRQIKADGLPTAVYSHIAGAATS